MRHVHDSQAEGIGIGARKDRVEPISMHFAAWLLDLGHDVTLADCGMPHSSSEWIRQAVPEIRCRKSSGDRHIPRVEVT